MALKTSPSTSIYRALPVLPLNWESKHGHPCDGNVKSSVNSDTGANVHTLRAQPRKNGRYVGVSFFAPSMQYSKASHQHLGGTGKCAVLVPNSTLPGALGIVNDGPLFLPLEGGDKILCGEHYTLVSTSDMRVADFEAFYTQLLGESSALCELDEATQLPDLQLDMDYLPADRRTCAAMMALDELSSKATDPNVRFFSNLYALHLRAMDMAFEEVLTFGSLASMAAAALEVCTVHDGFLMASVCEAQDLLAEVLERDTTRPAYLPHSVQPFQFVSGKYTDELFDKEVQVCARAYVGDEELRKKVEQVAKDLFEVLASDRTTVKAKSCTLLHCGVTFEVKCAM